MIKEKFLPENDVAKFQEFCKINQGKIEQLKGMSKEDLERKVAIMYWGFEQMKNTMLASVKEFMLERVKELKEITLNHVTEIKDKFLSSGNEIMPLLSQMEEKAKKYEKAAFILKEGLSDIINLPEKNFLDDLIHDDYINVIKGAIKTRVQMRSA